jgi:cytochrome b6-f complex iron-sulfur subunit
MSSGLVAGYGTLAAFAGRFLYPTAERSENWQFVSTLSQLKLDQSVAFQTPSGEKVVIARQQEGETADSFVALSSVCPHLGCSVHWESHNKRFFCPCHNGVFDASGTATEGPPAAASQSLTKFPLKVENGLLYIAVSSDTLTRSKKA